TRNWTASVAPWAANCSATARPIPREPPVTSTPAPSRSIRIACPVRPLACPGRPVDVRTYRLTLKLSDEEDPMGELQGAGGYRVGDADRNRTADLLNEAHAAGYLTLEEAGEGLASPLPARPRGELDRLVADLPPEWRASQEPA